jgi:hypothetical protein
LPLLFLFCFSVCVSVQGSKLNYWFTYSSAGISCDTPMFAVEAGNFIDDSESIESSSAAVHQNSNMNSIPSIQQFHQQDFNSDSNQNLDSNHEQIQLCQQKHFQQTVKKKTNMKNLYRNIT